jgi:hypothetical protein
VLLVAQGRLQAAHFQVLGLLLGLQVGEGAGQRELQLGGLVLVAQLLVVELGQGRGSQLLVQLQNDLARLHPRAHRQRHPPDATLQGAAEHRLAGRNDGASSGEGGVYVAHFHGGGEDVGAAQGGLQDAAQP